jgi:hypothetical protein
MASGHRGDMLQVMVLLGLAGVWLATPDRANAQAARVGVEASGSRPTAALHPTPRAVSIPDSVRKKVGYQHWRGAAIGGAVGAAGGVLLALLARGQCSDCVSNDSRVPEVGFLGAALGGAFGFLVGAASPKYRWVPSEAGQPQEARPPSSR